MSARPAIPDACPYPAAPPPVPVQMVVPAASPCPYLPDRESLNRAFAAEALPGELYHDFMDRGFRRAGHVFYQPVCRGCRACLPIRVRCADFRPSKTQRRRWKSNLDLSLSIAPPRASEEKFALYTSYLRAKHNRACDGDDAREEFELFLYATPVDTLEFEHRDPSGKLVAVGICDITSRSLSSVYFYYDPSERGRSLGVFGALAEIEFAREAGIPYYYLGFWIDGCASMAYKDDFRPNEILHPDGAWRAHRG